jgi:hypothetical protein
MRTPSTVAAILATALVAAGCAGGSEEADREGPAASDRSSQPSEGVGNLDGGSSEEETAPAQTPSEEAPTEDSGGAVASRDGQIDGEAVRLEITDLVRSGSTTALTFELSVAETRAGETEASAQIAQTFDDGLAEATGGKGQDSFTADGISLIDATNGKRYLVARDSGGVCVCDGNLASRFVEPAAPTGLSATFGAPPADVESVDVVIPSFGTFKNVPLS